MTTALASAVELLDRSLAYTRVALTRVEDSSGSDPTPCHGWPLSALLAHMDDGLDAWTEAATGRLSVAPTAGLTRLDSIRTKACSLLGWWLERPDAAVRVSDRVLPADVLVGVAALEITVHGWDLYRTAGDDVPIPADLAHPLLGLAESVVPGDPLPCFAPPVPVDPSAPPARRLLGLAGRT